MDSDRPEGQRRYQSSWPGHLIRGKGNIMDLEKYYEAISEAVYDGDDEETLVAVEAALEAGCPPEDIINKGGVAALERLGKDFDEMNAFLPDMMLGGEAMHALLDRVNPLLVKEGKGESATIVLGCAQGDLHDIGLNLVATQLAVAGYNVINLGTDTSPAEFLRVADENHADIIGVSTLLTTSSYYQDEMIKDMVKKGIRDRYKVIVGGGPITPQWTEKIGADGYSRTAHQAVELCKRLLQGGEELPVVIE